jgi:hypothetical protein
MRCSDVSRAVLRDNIKQTQTAFPVHVYTSAASQSATAQSENPDSVSSRRSCGRPQTGLESRAAQQARRLFAGNIVARVSRCLALEMVPAHLGRRSSRPVRLGERCAQISRQPPVVGGRLHLCRQRWRRGEGKAARDAFWRASFVQSEPCEHERQRDAIAPEERLRVLVAQQRAQAQDNLLQR